MKKLPAKKVCNDQRAEYIKVGSNVRPHITDAGEGQPVILIPGWPLSDKMYEYQHNDLINDDFPFNLPKSAVDELIELSYQDRPKLYPISEKYFPQLKPH